jgi:regulator of vacuolar morphogenesis
MADPIRSVHIPTAEHKSSPSSHIAYRLDVQAAVRAWSVWRRYSQFDQLHRDLLRIHPQHPPPLPLPTKHYFSFTSTASSPAYIEQRRQGLEKYIQALLNDPDPRWRRTHEWREFLGVPTARAFTEDHFTASSWMEELRAVQGALRECRALIHRREASAARKDTAEVHRCTQDARRRLQGLAEQVRALEAGLKSLTISRGGGNRNDGNSNFDDDRDYNNYNTNDDDDYNNSDNDNGNGSRPGGGRNSCCITEAEKLRRQDLLEEMRTDLRTFTRLVEGRPTVASNNAERRDLLQHHDGTGNAYGYGNSTSSGSGTKPTFNRSNTVHNVGLSTSPASTNGPQSRRVFGRSPTLASETTETRSLDNNELLNHQQTLMQRQDDHMAQLSGVLQQQRQIALAVGDELDMQNQMLNELDGDVERVADKLSRTGRQLDKIH